MRSKKNGKKRRQKIISKPVTVKHSRNINKITDIAFLYRFAYICTLDVLRIKLSPCKVVEVFIQGYS